MNKRMIRRVIAFALCIVLFVQILPVRATGMTTKYENDTKYEKEEEIPLPYEEEREETDIPLLEGTETDPDSQAVFPERGEAENILLIGENESARSEFSKEFIKENGQNLIAIYPLAVHYQKEKKWEEIDNRLLLTEDGYRNTAGAWEIHLPRVMEPGSETALSYEGHKLSFSLDSTVRGEGKISEKEKDDLEGRWNIQTLPEGFASRIEYGDAGEIVQVRYDLVSDHLEESIIFLDKPKTSEVSYRIHSGDLYLELNKENQMVAYAICKDKPEKTGEKATDGDSGKEAEPIFLFEVPYLYDADGIPCFEVKTRLEKTEDGYLLTYVLPESWLKAEERQYPVTFDPVIKPALSTGNIQDQTIYQNSSYTTSPNWGMVEFGRDASYGIARFVMKYNNLPELKSSDVLTHAELKLNKLQVSSNPGEIHVHALNGAWTEDTINWSNCPSYKAEAADYRYVYNSGDYYFDITDIARNWYEAENTGVLFKASNAIEQGSVSNWKQFCSSEYGGDKIPVLEISYLNNSGIENCWEYETTEVGRAGTGYVNDFTGNLTFIHTDMGFEGKRMPVTIQHIYNVSERDENRFGLGNGWRTNYNQKVYPWTGNRDYYIWEDGDGTYLYFKKDPDHVGEYKEERGSGLILTTSGTGNETYCIRDEKERLQFFDARGRLTEIRNHQETSSSIFVNYMSSSSDSIQSVVDGAGRSYLFAYSQGKLSSLRFQGSDNTERYRVAYRYSDNGNNLIQVRYLDGKRVNYTYSDDNLLQSAQDIDGYMVEYEYSNTDSDLPSRVSRITTHDGENEGGSLTLSYAHNETTLTDHNGNKEILQFSDWGNVISVQDGQGRAEFSMYAQQNLNGDASKANQLIRQSKLQNTVNNLLCNSSFEYSGKWNLYSGNAESGSKSASLCQ